MDYTSTQSWLRQATDGRDIRTASPLNIFETIEPQQPQPPTTIRPSKHTSSNFIASPIRTYVPSRPQLLKQIEDYLHQNLSNLTPDDLLLTEEWLGNKKLQIYREAFQMYINDSNVYKPFLMDVKHEYEVILDFFCGR